MNRRLTSALALTLLVPALCAIEKPFQNGQIVNIQQKAREEVLLYLVNTPITRDNPYFEVTVQLKDAIVIGEYTPFHASETLPEDWKIGTMVDVRLRDKHHMALKKPGSGEMEFIVVKRTALEPGQKAPPPGK
jgi:hypothetical protein